MFNIKDMYLQLGDFHLTDINLQIHAGEYRILLGPTGTGKTVLLETIAGLHVPQTGHIILNDTDITRTAPEQRNIGVVYQDYALFPHLTVFENIAFGLKLKRITREKLDRSVQEMAGFLNINHLLKRRQANLSGGECQRVALARTLVLKPSLLLLDEPLSAVDRLTGEHLRTELQKIHQELGLAILHITHDLNEAFLLGDTMSVMQDGVILQDGTPDAVFQKPATRLVAELLGIKNFLPAMVTSNGLLKVKGLGTLDRANSDQGLSGAKNPLVSFPDWAVEIMPAHSQEEYLWQGDAIVRDISNTDNQVLVTLETSEKATICTSYSRREIHGLATPLTPGLSVRTGIHNKGVHVISNADDEDIAQKTSNVL